MTGHRELVRTVASSLVAGAVMFALAALVMVWLRGDADSTRAHVSDGAVGVAELIRHPGARAVAVSGFVFVGEHRTILCSDRTTEDPPFCDGTTVDVEGLDPARVALEHPDGAPAYSADAITLLGDYAAGTLTVVEILAS